MKTQLLALAFLSLIPSLATAAPAVPTPPTSSGIADIAYRLPVPEIETLPNGLKIAWFVSPSLPVVDFALIVRSGSRDDQQGKSGTASLFSQVLDRGAGGMTADEISEAIESLGASRYYAVDEDQISIGFHGLAPDAPTLMDLLGKIALHPAFPAAEVSREKARMLDRWKSMADYGEDLVGLAFQRAVSGGTIYGRGSFLSGREFRNVTREDVISFHRKNFTPKNSVLLVVGRVNKKELRQQIEKEFGDWKGELPAHHWVKYQAAWLKSAGKAHPVLVLDRPGLNQTQVRMGFRAPLFTDKRHYSLTVANALLGEHFESRLNSLIREKLGLTYAISSGYSYSQYNAGFGISSATKTENVGKLIRKTNEVLRILKKGPIPDDEIQVAKDYLIGGFPLGTATLEAVASRWLNGHFYGLGPEYLNEFVPKITAVTPVDVVHAVDQTYDLDKMVVVVAGDAKEIEKSLKHAGLPYRRVSVRDLMW